MNELIIFLKKFLEKDNYKYDRLKSYTLALNPRYDLNNRRLYLSYKYAIKFFVKNFNVLLKKYLFFLKLLDYKDDLLIEYWEYNWFYYIVENKLQNISFPPVQENILDCMLNFSSKKIKISDFQDKWFLYLTDRSNYEVVEILKTKVVENLYDILYIEYEIMKIKNSIYSIEETNLFFEKLTLAKESLSEIKYLYLTSWDLHNSNFKRTNNNKYIYIDIDEIGFLSYYYDIVGLIRYLWEDNKEYIFNRYEEVFWKIDKNILDIFVYYRKLHHSE